MVFVTPIDTSTMSIGDVTGVTLGHEGIGKVIEVAEDVESLKIGDRC